MYLIYHPLDSGDSVVLDLQEDEIYYNENELNYETTFFWSQVPVEVVAVNRYVPIDDIITLFDDEDGLNEFFYTGSRAIKAQRLEFMPQDSHVYALTSNEDSQLEIKDVTAASSSSQSDENSSHKIPAEHIAEEDDKSSADVEDEEEDDDEKHESK